MTEMIMVPFSHLILRHREIGIHRGRRWGFRDVFGFSTLRNVPFVTLASRIKDAYEGKDAPLHVGWPAQREALQWLVEKGLTGIYALDEQGIKLMPKRPPDSAPDLDVLDVNEQAIHRAVLDEEGLLHVGSESDILDEQITLTDKPNRYYISDGHHRALALYVLGEDKVRARVLSEEEARAHIKS